MYPDDLILQGVDLNVKSSSGDTARSQAMMAGHTKIVTLIDNHTGRKASDLEITPSVVIIV